jgi:acetyltransferase-like isoleucine patch superfamily enzyme
LIDCTESIQVGAFATVAGFRSQLLTHSIDIERAQQRAAPIRIGQYCFVGTDCVLLGGSALPDYSVLGAKSLLNSKFDEPYGLYGGVPASRVKTLSQQTAYFTRTIGFVD